MAEAAQFVGKSFSEDRATKCFGFVNRYDVKPRRRLFEHLKTQGLQINQPVTFLSDGGDAVRDLPYFSQSAIRTSARLVSYHDASHGDAAIE